jgi:mono/diheme cytochrome c family protein
MIDNLVKSLFWNCWEPFYEAVTASVFAFSFDATGRHDSSASTSIPPRAGLRVPGQWFKNLTTLILVLVIALMMTGKAYAQDDEDDYEAVLELGRKVYEIRCLLCHGAQGDGKGYVGTIRRAEKNGRILEVLSRDLVPGVFRFRTTPTGCLPDDADLLNTVTEGIPVSFMPSHKELQLVEREAVIEYVKEFSGRWYEEDLCDPIEMEEPGWVGSPRSIERGRKVYQEMKCGECHGYDGKGDGPKSNEIFDDWGKQIVPFNFATGELKRGSSPRNVYITFTTGLDGTGMPSYEDSLNEEDRWHLVSFTLLLMNKII